MKKFLGFLLLITTIGHSQNLQQIYTDGIAAYKAKDYKAFYEKMKEANNIHPYHQGIQYQLGMAAVLNNKASEGIGFLKKAILTNTDFVIENNPDLKSIETSQGFKDLVALQKKWKEPIIHSDTAFIIKDRKLHTEGIDYDKRSKTFYLGSIHKRKVVKVDEKGNASDFCSSAFEGMCSVFGLKVDVKHNLLWVCSSPMQEMQDYDSTARSSVFKFDLKNEKLIKKYELNEPSVFGDIILNKNGEPLISDSQNNNIYVINEKTQSLENYFNTDEFRNIQGIAFSDDEKYLFVSDYIAGIYRIDWKARTYEKLTCTLDVSLKGIDGLYFYKNSLIAVQNGVNPLGVTQYFLNPKMTVITKFEVLDKNHPAHNEPTLGTLQGNEFYYIANSQWSGYENGVIKPTEKLQDIVILKLLLK